jgi:predicted MPP superfamily phosphohydrolase
MNDRSKYLFFTDTHLLPFQRSRMLNHILDATPHGVFLTGDITYGPDLIPVLEYLGSRIGRPLYFVLGNHDYHGSSIDKVHDQVRKLCQKHKNLIWMTEAGIVPLNEETCLIGSEGWYSARHGDPRFVKFTFDWFLTKDFRDLPNWEARFDKFGALADQSAEHLSKLLEQAIGTYKTVICLTHMPAWPEANRDIGTVMEKFWLPYNVNTSLGQALEKVMLPHKKRKLIVLCGHTHTPVHIHVSRNIECQVGKNGIGKNELLYI